MRSIKELMSLDGRVVLVTGGAGHIGAAMSEAIAEQGAAVVIADRDLAECEAVAARISGQGHGRCAWLEADLLDESSTRGLVKRVLDKHGRLDGLIHSAAFVGTTVFPGWGVPFEQQSVAAWDAAFRVNLTSAFALVQEAAPALKETGNGAVVFIGSTYGLVGPDMSIYNGTAMANPAAYGASKGGLMQLMRYLATVLAPYVRVNAITPGGVWRNQPEVFHERYKQKTPLGRMATEEDFKGAAVYLMSDLSRYVTGHNLVVDGGWTTW
ncbi:MAG: SDR family oxidoreductase [Myxococcota bacterium]|jgi:NAD(P)-dependent dehydrogenase (short-subunit alcohol dehydrogenase family)